MQWSHIHMIDIRFMKYVLWGNHESNHFVYNGAGTLHKGGLYFLTYKLGQEHFSLSKFDLDVTRNLWD